MNLPFASQVYRAEESPSPTALEALRTELRNEVRALRTLVSQQTQRAQQVETGEGAAIDRELARELAAIRETLGELAPNGKRDKRDPVAAWLRARGVEGTAAVRIAAAAKKVEGDLDAKLRAAVAEVVAVDPMPETVEGRRVIALVGPSGVGKTTTAAKLAAQARVAGKSVALVSCDGFRVGAIDQLERYAELLGASFHVARNAAELDACLAAITADVIFVDTSGRPPAPASPEATLRKREPRAEVLLCMAASTRAADAARIAATFAPAKPTGVCVTKLDETDAPSGLVHAPLAAKKPLGVLCYGPRVPEDMEPATHDDVMKHLHGKAAGR